MLVVSAMIKLKFKAFVLSFLTVLFFVIALPTISYSGSENKSIATQNLSEKLREVIEQAERGDATAQWLLGGLYAGDEYAKSFGVSQNYTEAAKWFHKAADQNHAEAQRSLGIMYAGGQGVSQDYIEAEKWFRKSAEKGNPGAQRFLGMTYSNGYGVVQDYVEAVKWYCRAADQGDGEAQNNLGSMYAQGKGVPQDDTEAVKWYRKAADQGIEKAQNNLHIMAENADTVYDRFMEHDRAVALAKQGKTIEQADQEAALAARKTSQADRRLDIAEKGLNGKAVGQGQYEIQATGNDETFVINDEVFKAKNYCMGWDEGDRVLFVEGSPLGACTSAKLYNVDNEKTCEVWCE